MTEKIELTALWGVRKESAEQCAERMLRFLNDLGACDEVFARGWLVNPDLPPPGACPSSRPPKRRVRFVPLEVSFPSLRRFIAGRRFRRAADGSIIDDLGFSPGRLWNGQPGAKVFVRISCGSYFWRTPNSVWLDFPEEGREADRLLRPDKLRGVIAALAQAWDPDCVRVSTAQLDFALYPQQPYERQRVGWLTYISDRYGSLPPLPPTCEVTRVDKLGSIILINSITRPSAAIEAHVQELKRLSDVLDKAGMLAPVPPEQL